MKKITTAMLTAVAVMAAASAVTYASSEAGPKILTILDPKTAKFDDIPGTPFGNLNLRGDVSKEAGTFMSRTRAGGVANWHRHTPIEEFAVLTGTAIVQVSGHAPVTLKTGGYSQVPGGAAHRFRCISKEACVLFVVGSGAYDMHWVTKDNREISDAENKSRPTEVGKTW